MAIPRSFFALEENAGCAHGQSPSGGVDADHVDEVLKGKVPRVFSNAEVDAEGDEDRVDKNVQPCGGEHPVVPPELGACGLAVQTQGEEDSRDGGEALDNSVYPWSGIVVRQCCELLWGQWRWHGRAYGGRIISLLDEHVDIPSIC